MLYNVARVRRLSTKFQVNTCKTKKDSSMQCAVAHLVVEIQAMIYNAAKVRRLSTIFQVGTCKTKKDRIAHVQLSQAMIYNAARVRKLSCKIGRSRFGHAKTNRRYICACAVAHLAVEIQDMIYNVARVRKLFTKFQVDTCKTKKDTSVRMPCSCAPCIEIQDMIYNVARQSGGYLQNFKSIHAKVKKIDLLMRSCAPCS